MGKITTIPTTLNSYGDALESETITVRSESGGVLGTTTCCVWQSGRREHGGPVIDEPFASLIQHATVIDRHGGSAREAWSAPLQVTLGDLVVVGGFAGIWQVCRRDERRFQGEGFRLVPYLTDPGEYGHTAKSRDATIGGGDG